MKKQIVVSIIGILIAAAAISAQTRQPSTAIRPVLVISKQSLADLEKKLAADKTDVDSKNPTVTRVEDLIGGPGMETRVAIQHDSRRGGDMVELHDRSDDVYYVLKGQATLELGGVQVDAKEVSPGEWKSKTVTGAKSFVIKPGDLVMVPRGTPHRRTVTGKGFSMILIKIFEDPIPAK
jgi:mannose-6-phosphate isomerase-like protein (cupin superfamily)